MSRVIKNTIRYIAAGAVMASVFTQSTLACMNENDEMADKIRFMQTQMMVAAMQCRKANDGVMPHLYNNFIKGHRGQLIQSGQRLEVYLARTQKIDVASYLNAIANRLSVDSGDEPQFCGRMRMVMEMSANLNNPLALLDIMPVKYKRRVGRCQSQPDSHVIAMNDIKF